MLQVFAFINTLIFIPITIFQVALGFGVYLLGKVFGSKKLRVHGKDLALAGDQNMNVVWLGNPDETISSRCGRAVVSGRPKWFVRGFLRPFIDWAARRFGDGLNHCVRSIEVDEDIQYEVWKWHR